MSRLVPKLVPKLVNQAEAVRTVMKLLSIEGTTGRERAVARFVASEIRRCRLPGARVRHDDAHRRLPASSVPGAQVGNLIVDIPGRGALAREKPRLFSAHMDTVSIAAGARPVRKGNTVRPRGETALGADCRGGVGVLVTLAKTLAKTPARSSTLGGTGHVPVVLLFTIAEETGLWGSRNVDRRPLKRCAMGFNFDSGGPGGVIVGAPSSSKFHLEIDGHASHAGVHPDRGISAGAIFAEAYARVVRGGWHGKVVKGRERGTSNIGVVEGGEATNIVMPHLRADGEVRSYSEVFLEKMLAVYRCEFERAAERASRKLKKSTGAKEPKEPKGRKGGKAKVRFTVEPIYHTFDLRPDEPAVRTALAALDASGVEAGLVREFGGLDANWLVKWGVPTVTLGAGMHGAHQVGETLNLEEYLTACEVAVRLATAGS